MEHARKDLRIQHAAGKIPKQQIKQVTHLIHRSFRLSLLPVSLPLLTAAEIADALDQIAIEEQDNVKQAHHQRQNAPEIARQQLLHNRSR